MKLTKDYIEQLISEELESLSEEKIDEIAPAVAAAGKMAAKALAAKAGEKVGEKVGKGIRTASNFIKARKAQPALEQGTSADEIEVMSKLDKLLQKAASEGNLMTGKTKTIINMLIAELEPNSES